MKNVENMESGFKISEFCHKYMSIVDKEKNAYLMSIINTEYISYLIRANVAEQTVKKVCTFKEGLIQKNTAMNYINKVVSFFVIHSTLDFEKLPSVVIYDLLNKAEIIKPFCSILEKEWDEYEYIYDSMESDLYANNTTALSFFTKQVTRFGTLVGNGIDKLVDTINKIDFGELNKKVKPVMDTAKNIIKDKEKTESESSKIVNIDNATDNKSETNE